MSIHASKENSTFTGFLEHVAQYNQVPIKKKYEQNPKSKATPHGSPSA
tara:strand:- start:18911 stop:19054 length:144 start_codon:yes stop_codon:yes gene_type:complete